MANTVYTPWKVAMMTAATPDLSSAGTDIRAILVDSADYTYSASHEFLASIPSGARVATSTALVNKAVTAAAVFDADDITLTGVTGDRYEYIVLYQHTGSDSTARLFCRIDTATGLPSTPNSNAVTITWPAAGIVSLA